MPATTNWHAWAAAQVAHYERVDAARVDALVRNYETPLSAQQLLALLEAT